MPGMIVAPQPLAVEEGAKVLMRGGNAYDAVLAPRFDCQGETIFCQSRIPEFVCAEVRKKHPIRRIPDAHGGMALVHAIALHPETGRLEGAADTGADGMALLVE